MFRLLLKNSKTLRRWLNLAEDETINRWLANPVQKKIYMWCLRIILIILVIGLYSTVQENHAYCKIAYGDQCEYKLINEPWLLECVCYKGIHNPQEEGLNEYLETETGGLIKNYSMDDTAKPSYNVSKYVLPVEEWK